MSDLVLNICHCNNLFLKEWSIYLSSCFDYSGNLRMFFFKIILLESTCYLWTSNVKYLCAWYMIIGTYFIVADTIYNIDENAEVCWMSWSWFSSILSLVNLLLSYYIGKSPKNEFWRPKLYSAEELEKTYGGSKSIKCIWWDTEFSSQ